VNSAPALNPETSSGGSQSILFGRFMLPDMSEYPCQVTNLSVDGATFVTDHVPLGGQNIVAYLDEIGRIEAVSADPVPGGFRVLFPQTGARRERLAARIRFYLDKSDDDSGASLRRHIRYEPKDNKSHITLPDGRVYQCEVLDISLSGAAVKVDVLPSLGTYIMLGKMRGRIVRYLDSGVGIEFVKPLDNAQLSEHIR
jgi:hypothetical protein